MRATWTCALALPLVPFTCTGLVVVDYRVLGAGDSRGQPVSSAVARLELSSAGAQAGPGAGKQAAALCCAQERGDEWSRRKEVRGLQGAQQTFLR